MLLFCDRCYRPLEEDLNTRECGYLSILSILLFLLLGSCLIPVNCNYIYNPFSLFLYVTLLLSIFFIYVVCFKMLSRTHERLKAQDQLMQACHQLEIRDDFRHHLIILQKLLDAGDLEQAHSYLQEYTRNMDDNALVTYCKNVVVNILVSHYKAQAEENGIRFQCQIHITQKLTLPASDLSVL